MSHEEGLGKLWTEIGRRNVGRVAVVYAGAAWGLVHMSTVMAEALETPHWVNRFLVFLLIALAPVVIGFSWVFELTPEGFKRAEDVERNQALSSRTARRLNIAIIVLMVLLAGLYGVDRFLLPHEGSEGEAHHATEAAKAPAADGGVSIAVLPFVNLSGDPGQEFFSDGMTEEITSALAKVKGLRVVGRTSAFEFKGQNKDLRAIGQALGTTNLLEGSVRKVGNRVRITGQLIRAGDGSHIWTENYDRELTDIFATQEDIAHAIAGALQAPLGLNAGETLVANRDINPENYEQYLRAKALLRARGDIADSSATKAIGLLESLVAAEPRYSPAWALLARAYFATAQEGPTFEVNQLEDLELITAKASAKARVAAQRTLDLDPRSAEGYVALADSEPPANLLAKEDFLKQAFQLEPLNDIVLAKYSTFLATVGRVKEAVVMRQKLLSLNATPLVRSNLGTMLWLDGQNEAALALAKALPLTTNNRATDLARTYAAMGRYGDAADAILTTPVGGRGYAERDAAAALLRKAPNKVSPRDLPDLKNWTFVYLYVGAPERADLGMINWPTGVRYFWLHSSYAPVRKTKAFKEAARRYGFVDYWRARGWPDVCHPIGADDFACN